MIHNYDHLDNVDNTINFERMILFDYIYQTMREVFWVWGSSIHSPARQNYHVSVNRPRVLVASNGRNRICVSGSEEVITTPSWEVDLLGAWDRGFGIWLSCRGITIMRGKNEAGHLRLRGRMDVGDIRWNPTHIHFRHTTRFNPISQHFVPLLVYIE